MAEQSAEPKEREAALLTGSAEIGMSARLFEILPFIIGHTYPTFKMFQAHFLFFQTLTKTEEKFVSKTQ